MTPREEWIAVGGTVQPAPARLPAAREDAADRLEAQESWMDHPTSMRSIELMGEKVIPAPARL